MFEEEHGIQVRVIAVGSGQALEMGRRGDVDVLLTHAPEAEEAFVGEGFGTNRRGVMYNDFVVVGPPDDPASIKEENSVCEAVRKIRVRRSPFVSRGDNSGTHRKEREIWWQAELQPTGEWYLVAGSGMAAALRVASEKQAYTLCDRGTFLSQQESLELAIVFEGDEMLRNDYAVTPISPKKHPHVHTTAAEKFAVFLQTPETQKIIAEFGREKFGQSLFFPRTW